MEYRIQCRLDTEWSWLSHWREPSGALSADSGKGYPQNTRHDKNPRRMACQTRPSGTQKSNKP